MTTNSKFKIMPLISARKTLLSSTERSTITKEDKLKSLKSNVEESEIVLDEDLYIKNSRVLF